MRDSRNFFDPYLDGFPKEWSLSSHKFTPDPNIIELCPHVHGPDIKMLTLDHGMYSPNITVDLIYCGIRIR